MKTLLNCAKIVLGVSSLTLIAHADRHLMVIDEWSSTSLSLTYNGQTVWGTRINEQPEGWDLTGLGKFGINLTADQVDAMNNVTPGTADDLFHVGWQEPDHSGNYNFIDGVGWGNGGYPLVTDLLLVSDFNGQPAPYNMLTNDMIYSDNILPFAIKFNDHGDSAPDGAPTGALLGAALAACLVLRRIGTSVLL